MWIVPSDGDRWTPPGDHPLRIRPEGERDVERYMDWPEGPEYWEDLPDEVATHDRAHAENQIRDRRRWVLERAPGPHDEWGSDEWGDRITLEHHELLGLIAHRRDIEWTSRTHGGVFGAPR